MKAENIIIIGARENNLKNISLEIPTNKITVFTGVSGSGKSSLVFDTIAAESQRQLNETFPAFIRHRLPHYGQPAAESLRNLSPAIIIEQKRIGGNARSTVGTATDIYTLLRLLFSRIGKPFVGHSDVFSFNHPNGMCTKCKGLGKVTSVDLELLFDKSMSLNEGAILFPTFAEGTARWKRYTCSGLFDNNKKLIDYTKEEWHHLLYAHHDEVELKNPLPCWFASTKYEGVIPKFERTYLTRETKDLTGKHKKTFERILTRSVCPDCRGGRLNKKILSCRIDGHSIADFTKMDISELKKAVEKIKVTIAGTMVNAILEQLNHMIDIGLGYLFLGRETSSLSGGESQRIKMVRHLGSSLTGMTYIFDEPSIGLHPKDVDQLNDLLCLLRDKGNTVLVVEHDTDVISIADHVVDMGPKAGTKGGEIVYEGPLKGLKEANTLTGKFWKIRHKIKENPKTATDHLEVKNASLHNLKNLNVKIPKSVMTVITGVAGSGKSSLANGILTKLYPESIVIDQSAIIGSKRSNTATYSRMFDVIRELFAIENRVSSSLFSSNSEGACLVCKGLGEITLDLAFMDPITTVCEECNGQRYRDEVLKYRLKGKNIYEVLKLTVLEALVFFRNKEAIYPILKKLDEVGLEYLTLGQPLSSLSGGERQRIKLALNMESKGQIYIMDEPTTGLHMSDVDRLLKIFNKIINEGSTLIIIEHNLAIISQADYIIDIGPDAGKDGGKIVFSGLPKDIIHCKTSYTGLYLNKYISSGMT
ncbi:ATP-binding cassette domain-containing protein [Pedobacter hiemivivus]|uniref:UvrABC system protein A n=1 Tax=Pedobacter hiemivivus TaxID=2530454 RepID=A0A4R0NA42_9SPHI|nr:excinuclease ABC subunit UvrA [Pedobacter hiemivivus]TCC96965.1 excinuclease ABC subunit UvrA [Pedobacter hiemivivus]